MVDYSLQIRRFALITFMTIPRLKSSCSRNNQNQSDCISYYRVTLYHILLGKLLQLIGQILGKCICAPLCTVATALSHSLEMAENKNKEGKFDYKKLKNIEKNQIFSWLSL